MAVHVHRGSQRHPLGHHPVPQHAPTPVAHAVAHPVAPAAAPHVAAAPPAATQQVFSHLADGPELVPDVHLNTAGLTPNAAPAATTSSNPLIVPNDLTDVPSVSLNTAGLTPVGGAAATTPATAATGATPQHVRPTVAQYAGGLDAQIDADINGNRIARGLLDTQNKTHSPSAATTETQLNGNRQHLLDELKERHAVYDTEIKGIDAKLGPVPKHPSAEQAALLAQKNQLEKAEHKYSDQETASQRWHDRGEINGIDTQLKDPKLETKTRTELLARKKVLASGLLSTTTRFQQFDARWGSTVYGKDKSYTTMTAAGCGPTGLADMLDFRDQEDPEGQHSRGVKEAITPRTTADYATTHGRVKGSGTDGTAMMGSIGTAFPGMQGNTLANQQSVRDSLNDGVPVMFLGHNITGQGANGKAIKPYGGHYMVLNGVSDDGQSYSVLDGGRNDTRNMHSITSGQLSGHTGGYWNVSPSETPHSANNA